MTPYYDDGRGIVIYHGDCRAIAPSLQADAVVSDPPYGMGVDTWAGRYSGGNHQRGDGREWEPIHGDGEPFDPSPWLGYDRVVLWGANHYAQRLPVGTTLVWLKRKDSHFGTFLSDCEIAWMKGGHGVYAFRKLFPPPSRAFEAGGRMAHPAQKPLGLMSWCIRKCGATGTILDPYMGSGTTLVAAKLDGHKAVGIELSERYCEIAAKRLAQEVFDFAGNSGP